MGFIVNALQTGDLPLNDAPGEQIRFQIGAMTGFLGGICVFMAAHGLILGLWFFLPDRGNRLLLEFHQGLTDPGRLRIKTPEIANSSASQKEFG